MEYNTTLLAAYISNYHTGGKNKNKDIGEIKTVKVQKKYICMTRTSNYDDYLSCLGFVNADPQMWMFYTFERIQGQWMDFIQQ